MEYNRGLIWMFPGVEGGAWILADPYRALRDAGVSSAIEFHDWTPLFGTFDNLMSYERNRHDAARVAVHIAQYAREHPAAPIDLIGYSGGGGMAVMVAEAIPEDVAIRNILLVQPAISREYDLSRALRPVRGKLVNFYAPSDWFILGAGTSTFGTMDRKFGPSAGKDGFVVERAVPRAELRPHFEQRCWKWDDLAIGHAGTHASIISYAWNRRVVAPYLHDPDPTTSQPGLIAP